MYLLLSIVLSLVLGYILLMMGPLGGIVAFGIVVGCIFRGLYLLNDIHKRISNIPPKEDKVQQAYKKYIEEKNKLLLTLSVAIIQEGKYPFLKIKVS